MDQDVLVNQRLEAGAELVGRFNETFPVAAAFWMKPDEASAWNLFMASDALDRARIREGNREMLRLLREIHNPELHPFRVRLLPPDDPRVVSVREILPLLPRDSAMHLRDRLIGNVIVDEVVIYPLPGATALAQG
jgi:hypothetical protein